MLQNNNVFIVFRILSLLEWKGLIGNLLEVSFDL